MFKMHLTTLCHSIILVLEWRFSDIYDSSILITDLTVINNHLIGLTAAKRQIRDENWFNNQQTWTHFCISNELSIYNLLMVLLSHSYFIYLSSFCCTKTKTQKNLLDPLDMKTHYIYNIAFYLCCTASHFSTLCSNAHITLYAMSVMEFSFLRLSTKIFWSKQRWWSSAPG